MTGAVRTLAHSQERLSEVGLGVVQRVRIKPRGAIDQPLRKARYENHTPLYNEVYVLTISAKSFAWTHLMVRPGLETIKELWDHFADFVSEVFMTADIMYSESREILILHDLIAQKKSVVKCRAVFVLVVGPNSSFRVDSNWVLIVVLLSNGAFRQFVPADLRARFFISFALFFLCRQPWWVWYVRRYAKEIVWVSYRHSNLRCSLQLPLMCAESHEPQKNKNSWSWFSGTGLWHMLVWIGWGPAQENRSESVFHHIDGSIQLED